jgi:hypothetical protein
VALVKSQRRCESVVVVVVVTSLLPLSVKIESWQVVRKEKLYLVHDQGQYIKLDYLRVTLIAELQRSWELTPRAI